MSCSTTYYGPLDGPINPPEDPVQLALCEELMAEEPWITVAAAAIWDKKLAEELLEIVERRIGDVPELADFLDFRDDVKAELERINDEY